ncbi:hypothetical protein AVEN_20508-1 [Araneus ventricosus]|uniref:Uncharacterized protein n=1 Tax=Araneus ventricosus TaxID=182803 RepID=A0A4Y2BFE4_ARAVE|nr:hypothetical protein AVEN_6965-1 [Araneus ventricosus]GBL90259.1 hypothetical protein AVEN_20508-1 [Araneus ventricosus]
MLLVTVKRLRYRSSVGGAETEKGSRLSRSDLGFEFGDFQVRNPIPTKIRVYVGLLEVKSYIVGKTSTVRCGPKVRGGEASSGVILVIRPRYKIMRSIPK